MRITTLYTDPQISGPSKGRYTFLLSGLGAPLGDLAPQRLRGRIYHDHVQLLDQALHNRVLFAHPHHASGWPTLEMEDLRRLAVACVQAYAESSLKSILATPARTTDGEASSATLREILVAFALESQSGFDVVVMKTASGMQMNFLNENMDVIRPVHGRVLRKLGLENLHGFTHVPMFAAATIAVPKPSARDVLASRL